MNYIIKKFKTTAFNKRLPKYYIISDCGMHDPGFRFETKEEAQKFLNKNYQ